MGSERVERTVNSWKETNGRVKMGCCCLPPDRVKLTVNNKKETNGRVQNGPTVKMGFCYLPPERVKMGQDGLLLFTPWQNQTNSEQQERNKQHFQNGPRVKMGFRYLPPEKVKMECCCLPPDWVKLTVNSKKETNSRVKMGQGSRWASVFYPLKE